MVNNYPHGHFCWVELCSTDWAGAKSFYQNLFSWSAADQPIGDDQYYTMLQINGEDIGAMYQMPTEQQAQGVPSYWLSYVAVDNVEEVVRDAKELGATIVSEPCQVGASGKAAVICDPSGAMVALWQGQQHKGSAQLGADNTPCWFELATRELEDSAEFYKALFGWELEQKPMDGMQYTLIKVDGQEIGGMLQMDEQWPDDIPPHWMIYFQVQDSDAQAQAVKNLEGQVCVEPFDVPEVGRFAVVNDPQGAVFSMIRLEHVES